ncbi:hypothetical protein BAU15_10500 [Enterococcus sp. JM4C]|uniref:DUF2812 domain-containing protein n=1 Tax=Candidatus Enterococcus huntleyi TaxID=1857217 RepID=UPI00137A703D|nr:DUF2812 domain-containing protein [Enterococcus sp. JM4C]KAF1296207.1 hypothetical protein BAU15_10500 [Enterococcus sp. JM4C]
MRKFRLFIDIEKEEKYLERMAESGWGLVNYNSLGFYRFEKIVPEKRNYRIDYRLFANKKDYLNYLTLFEDSGWQAVSSNHGSSHHFFLPISSENQEMDIFSDADSSKERYKRYFALSAFFMALMIICLGIYLPGLKDIPTWYLAPDPFNQADFGFIGRILVKTFLASLRVVPLLLILALSIFSMVAAIKSYRLFKQKNS